jgi:hypothetical protein
MFRAKLQYFDTEKTHLLINSCNNFALKNILRLMIDQNILDLFSWAIMVKRYEFQALDLESFNLFLNQNLSNP